MLKLTDKQRKQLAWEAQSELARRSYRDYVVHVHRGNYKHFRHTEYIADRLEPIAQGKQKYIFIEMPPRHGKSMTVTESFPSYYLSKNPNKRVIAASYSDTLAKKFGRLNRSKLEEYGPELFGVSLSQSNSSQSNWDVAAEDGGMISTGIGGSITGQGADLLIIDDPFKNAQAANSQTIRDTVWDEWESTLSTRLHNNASVIVIMTRWHEDDIIGRLLERSPHDWERIRMPAIAEDEDDLLGRKIGEPLCPELGYDEKWAADKQKEVGTRTWNALFQQRPAPAGGTIFKRNWWKYYKVAPAHFDEIIQSWDCTFKDAETSDFVSGQVWGRIGADKYLLDRIKEKMGITGTMQAIRTMSAKWPQARAKLIEDKANGTAVIELLTKEIPGLIPVNPKGGKVVRAQAVAPEVEAGNVYVPDPSVAPWIHDYIGEFSTFPYGKNDDDVDGMTQALSRWHEPPADKKYVAPPMIGGVKRRG